MQNKGFVRVFAILLGVVCLFYLSFSIVTNKYNKEAAIYGNGDAARENLYLDSLSGKKVWLGYTLKECRENEITLGLDLKGGMNVILELNVADVIRSLSGNNKDENFNRALDAAYARQSSTSQRGFIDLFVEEFRRIDPNMRLSPFFGTFDLKDRISFQSSDEQVISVLKERLNETMDNSFNVLRTRIDRFGVISPNIQRLETDGRILIELPGVKEPERIRKLLQGSANLEFWETFEYSQLYGSLREADAILARLLEEQSYQEEITASNEATDNDTAVVSDLTADVTQETPIDGISEMDSLLVQLQTDQPTEMQTNEEFSKRNPLFSLLGSGRGPIVGLANKRDMAKIDSMLNMRQVKEVLPSNVLFRWSVKEADVDDPRYQLYALKVTNRDGSPALGGNVVTDANADFAQNQLGRSGRQAVSMAMNAEGAKAWARLTKDNIGNSIAIVLDDLVYSAPTVQVEITGGRSEITGTFSIEEAKDLANVLKSGKMAASVIIVQEEIIGPSLGQEAINAGVISFVVALIILMVYMCVIYGIVPGMIANGALIFNIFFTLGILASFKAVLTLPGIAGMVLTLGMAIDANVLIYERTKEELRAGKQLARALADGYGNAFSAIFDANITTMIAGIVLFLFGTGPIKGFAWTLLIGVAVSFLTAVFLTRMVYEGLIAKNKVKNLTFTTKLSQNFLVNPTIKFLDYRKIGYLIPLFIIVIGSISMATIGLNAGIDFTGGRNYVIRYDQYINTGALRNALDEQLDGQVSVITIGTANQVRVSTNFKIADNHPDVELEINERIYEGSKEFLSSNITLEQFTEDYIKSSQKVGPSMAEDIRRSAVLAVVIALFCMAIYILARFRDVGFSIGAFVSVLVNTLCIIAFYTLLWKILPFSMEVDQTFIAAILTVIGYSINDTVVVFDRIRETIHDYPKRDRYEVVNYALNSTLSRTFNTTFSTLLVVFIIFALGGATIRSFTFAIMLGVIVGTYTTLLVATPVAYEIQSRRMAKKRAALAPVTVKK